MRFADLCITFCSLFLIWAQDFTQGSPSPTLSEILDTLLKTYDKRVHPFHGSKPVTVGVTMYLLSLRVNDVDRQFTCSLYMRQMWQDNRLEFNTTDENKNANIELYREDFDKIWMPDTFVVNEIKSFLHQLTVPNTFVRISPSGSIVHSSRVTITASCPMDFSYFPFDTQICSLEIESYAKNTTQLKYAWARGVSGITTHTELKSKECEDFNGVKSRANYAHNGDPVFGVSGYRQGQLDVSLSSGNYSRIGFVFGLRRNWYGYKNTFFYPMIMFSCLSLVTIWISQYKIGAIVNLINIGLLNIFMVLIGIGSDYIKRKGAHSTAMDSFFSITNSTAIMCFLVNVVNLCLESRKDSNAQASGMSRLHAEGNDGVDIESRNRRSSEGSRIHLWNALPSIREITPGRIRILCETIIAKICFRFCHWFITGLYVVLNIYYWSYYPSQSVDLTKDIFEGVAPIED